MNLYCRFLLFLFSITVFAQQSKEFSVEMRAKYEPSLGQQIFVGKHISITSDLEPVFRYKEKALYSILENDYRLKILDKKLMSNTELSIIDKDLISEKLNLKINISKNKGVPYLNFEFNTLYKENNQYYQVKKVEVVYKYNNDITAKVNNSKKILANQNSVLSTGNWYKISVDKTGFFKLDAAFFSSIGLNVANINPNQIRVFGSGGAVLSEEIDEGNKNGLTENSIIVVGEEDGVFNNTDYVLFYAQGPISWELTSRNQIQHQQNYYSDQGFYFINVDSGIQGKRMNSQSNSTLSSTKQINTFTDYKLHELELINYVGTGKLWYGDDFSVDNLKEFEFDFPNINATQPVLVDLSYSTNSSSGSSYSFLINNETTTTNLSANSGRNGFAVNTSSLQYFPLSDLQEYRILYNNNGNASAQAHLDFIRVVADRNLRANTEQFGFVNFESLSNGEVLNYTIDNVSDIDYIFDVTDINNPINIEDENLTDDVFTFKEFTDGMINKYQSVNVSNLYTPSYIGLVPNQNLQALQDVHYLIITDGVLTTQAERLAVYHRNNTSISNLNSTHLNVEVVELSKIYNEFGSGAQDISAIRNFVKYLYDNATSDENRVKYLCLFGDSSYDYKKITHNNEINVPAFQSLFSSNLIDSYNSDDFYGYMDDVDLLINGGLYHFPDIDIATGRIPVKNTGEATTVVSKILRYYGTSSFGKWKNEVTLLGDDGQDGDNQGLIAALQGNTDTNGDIVDEGFAVYLESEDTNFNVTKLYSDAFRESVSSGGGTYPEVKSRFLDAFDNGSLVINYFGHGNSFGLAEENFLDIPDIRSLRNLNNLPLFITVTCDFSRFDDHTIVSGGEEMFLGELGGVSSMITTTRQILITAGVTISNLIAEKLFKKDEDKSIAEVLMDVKNSSSSGDKYFVYFLGDPAMKLSIPDIGVNIDKIEKLTKNSSTGEIELTEVTELQGLSQLKISGSVNDVVSNQLLNDFNGELNVTFYGAEIQRSTLLNEEGGVTSENNSSVVSYGSLENKLFVGSTVIENGKFSFNMVLPKDIGTIPESSKFSFYAFSESIEKRGSDFTFTVGGIDPDVEPDQTPPVISLFMENTTFVDGGLTTSTPELIVQLEDANGINTALSSIGHNISLVIDGDESNPVSLNEFYRTENNDFTKGIVNYELEPLVAGNHTVTLKAWDTHNNSATQTLSFVVSENSNLKITNVLNYPNPFVNHTEFWFKNNKVNTPLEIKIQIFTVSGKLIKTILGADANTNTNNTGFVRSITWDGKDDFGNKLGKGVYLYRLTVKDITSGETDNKLEKLVIL